MTVRKLNADIKKLYYEYNHKQYQSKEVFDQWVNEKGRDELIRVYRADWDFASISIESIKALIKMNYHLKVIENFGQYVKVKL